MPKKIIRGKRRGTLDCLDDTILILFEINSLIKDHPKRKPSEEELELLRVQGITYSYFVDNYKDFENAYNYLRKGDEVAS